MNTMVNSVVLHKERKQKIRKHNEAKNDVSQHTSINHQIHQIGKS